MRPGPFRTERKIEARGRRHAEFSGVLRPIAWGGNEGSLCWQRGEAAPAPNKPKPALAGLEYRPIRAACFFLIVVGFFLFGIL